MQKIAGILFSIGAFVSILGEFRPVISKVFGAIDNPQLQVGYIENDPTGWGVAHLLMGIGSLIAAFGVVLLARQVQSISNNSNLRIASNVGAAMAVVGALFWAIVSYNRVARAPQEVIANMGAANWMEWAYFLLTEIALILVGFVLLQTGYPKWLALAGARSGRADADRQLLRRRCSAFSLHFIPDPWNHPLAAALALASTVAFGDLE